MHRAIACNASASPQGSRGMTGRAPELESLIAEASRAGRLLEAAAQNIRALLSGSESRLYRDSVLELA
ncbi:MAG: hypothetical protein M3O66_07885, partial [Verrucomicrobiota bacterium]|nr:hypothetical protein [Verrucomicrobiota bacterium]